MCPSSSSKELPPCPALGAAGGGEQREPPRPPQTSMPGARPRPSACTKSSLSPLFSVRLTVGRGEGGTGSTSGTGCQGPQAPWACLDMVALVCWAGERWQWGAVAGSGLRVPPGRSGVASGEGARQGMGTRTWRWDREMGQGIGAGHRNRVRAGTETQMGQGKGTRTQRWDKA